MRPGPGRAINAHYSAVHVEIFIAGDVLLPQGNETECQFDGISLIWAVVREDVSTRLAEIARAAFGLASQASRVNPAVEDRSFQRITNLLSPAAHRGSRSRHSRFLDPEFPPGLSFREVALPTRGGMFDSCRVAHAQGATPRIIHRLEYKHAQLVFGTIVSNVETTFVLRDC
jgi:hypothetical protein